MIMTCTEKLKFSGEVTILQIFPFWGGEGEGEGGGGRGERTFARRKMETLITIQIKAD